MTIILQGHGPRRTARGGMSWSGFLGKDSSELKRPPGKKGGGSVGFLWGKPTKEERTRKKGCKLIATLELTEPAERLKPLQGKKKEGCKSRKKE